MTSDEREHQSKLKLVKAKRSCNLTAKKYISFIYLLKKFIWKCIEKFIKFKNYFHFYFI